MHPNPTFRTPSRQENLRFAAETGIGTLAIAGADGMPLMAHVPFVVQGNQVLFHLVRSNPIARAIGPDMGQGVPGKFFVQGPGSYISPDWYGIEDQVPTWNYVAVHMAGTIAPLPGDRLRQVLDLLSEQFEARLLPKPVWTADKVTDATMAKLMRQILPFEMRVQDVQGTWKLGQNKPQPARIGAARGVAEHGIGLGLDQLAEMMRAPPDSE